MGSTCNTSGDGQGTGYDGVKIGVGQEVGSHPGHTTGLGGEEANTLAGGVVWDPHHVAVGAELTEDGFAPTNVGTTVRPTQRELVP